MCFSHLLYELAGIRCPYCYIFRKKELICIVLSLDAMSRGLTCSLKISKIIILGHGGFGKIIWGMNRWSIGCITGLLFYDTKYKRKNRPL